MESDSKTTISGVFHSSHHACAACKYQRIKCKPDCLLAPFFPPSSHRDFLAVHRLFGVSNVMKTIRSFNSLAAKQAAAKSMIFQAKARAADPVGGCHRIICQLKNQILFVENELQRVRQQLHLHKILAASSQFVHKSPVNNNVDDAFADPVFWPEWRGEENGEQTVSVKGNYDPRQVFDEINLKIENERKVRRSCESSVILSQSDKQSDLSEDIKPFLGVFDDKFNSVFFDSKISDHSKVLLEDQKSIQLAEEEEHKDTS